MAQLKPHQHPHQPLQIEDASEQTLSAMQFSTELKDILQQVDNINAIQYAKTRNFINGAVTYLSPYISRGFLNLTTIRDAILSKYSPYQAEKILQELAWREYFQRVGQHYANAVEQDIKQPQQKVHHYNIPLAIVEANTGIHAIDAAIKNLYNTGYMHNHLRMYTAMLSCNVAKAHWLQPAKWLYYHLLDGDVFSNYLSWQWVAGSFSNKKYYANQENINKYAGTHQRNTYVDIPYEAFETLTIPQVLKPTTNFNYTTSLPSIPSLQINTSLPTFIYNTYNLDYTWHSNITANRILLLEPDHFNKYPISPNVLNWILTLAQKNIPGLQVYTGSFSSLQLLTGNSKLYFKEHPLNQHYKGIKEERSWMYPEVNGNFSSFFAYWKKCQRYLR